MKSKIKQILSIVMTVSMLSTMVPLTTYGADFTDDGTGAQSIVEVPAQNDVSAEEPDSDAGSAQTPDVSAGDQDDISSGDENPFTTDEDTFSTGEEPDVFSDDAANATATSIDDLYKTYGYDAPQLNTSNLYKIVFLDCGRKYFSESSIKQIIDNAAAAGFNYVELGIGNDGLRLLLDDMSLTVNGKDYASNDVKSAIQEGNSKYYNFGTNELTEAEMTDIISYANNKGLGIIPLVNTPGHMDAILSAANTLTGVTCSYNGSARTIDVTNPTAVEFTQAIVQKYIEYFSSQGCKFFNMGADEYANDIYENYQGMGFGYLQKHNQYEYYAKYVNKMADMIKGKEMTPMAFNDGIYYGGVDSYAFDKSIVINYWSSGWGNYSPMSAANLINKYHFKLINTHGDYYWVLGKSKCSVDKAKEFNYKSFQGSDGIDSLGGMFCIWCDYPGAETEGSVVSGTKDVIAAFGKTMAASDDIITTPTPAPDLTPVEKKITVSVGSKVEDTISGANYSGTGNYDTADPSIATVTVTGTDGSEAQEKYDQETVKVKNLTYGENNYADTGYYYRVNDSYYPLYNMYKRYVGYTLAYNDNGEYKPIGNYRGNSDFPVYSKSTTEAVPASTTVTFNGKSIGTTTVTVGNTTYTINVVAEDLSNVALTVEYWITNRQVTAGNATSKEIKATDSSVYSESGAKFSDLVPATGTKDNSIEMVFWKGTRLTSDKMQTKESGVDRTKEGNDFSYIRYWNSKWSFSADGKNWTDFNSSDQVTDQVVAYYLQKTQVTDEITTEVVDWGEVPHTGYNSENFVLVDYAVKYESGLRTPNSFPVSGKTQAFHCDSKDTTSVHYDQSAGKYYRTIGMVKAEENDDFEVYMITLTPNSDSTGTKVASNANQATKYNYGGTEKVVWVDKEEDLGDFSDESTHHADYSVGGDPIVDHLNIYNQQAMLVTYYIRTKKTEDSLTVNYIDDTTKVTFYDYNIAVNKGTVFKQNIALNNPWKQALENGDVINIKDKTETVSADLSTMPAISGQYRNSSYECVRVERSEDGKTVNLYYKFNNTHSFVIDYGLPFVITATDIGIQDGSWSASSVKGAKFGTAKLGDKILTYTPTKILTEVESLQLTLTSTDEDGKPSEVTHQIYIYPATTVYYEEGFATLKKGFAGGSKGNGTQTTEILDKHVGRYGYDDKAYKDNATTSSGDAATANEYGANASFAFVGTGVDIYLNCTTTTSPTFIKITDASGALEKYVTVDTKIGAGTTTATEEQASLGNAYSTPVVSATDLSYGTHNVYIAQLKSSDSDRTGLSFDGFRVYNTLKPLSDSANEYPEAERNPQYVELRNKVLANVNTNQSQYATDIAKKTAQVLATDESEIAAVMFSSSTRYTEENLQDLLDNGPKNEVYLYPNDRIVFNLTQDAQIGLKGVNGKTNYTMTGTDSGTLPTTDMFYNVSSGDITITNTGNNVLSITKIKYFGSTAPAQSLFGEISQEALTATLLSMGYAAADPAETPVTPTITEAPVTPTETPEPSITATPDPSVTVTPTETPVETPTATPSPTKEPEKPVKLSTPKLGKVVSASYNSVKVTWSKVKNADGYRVYMKENGKWKSVGKVNSNSYTCKGLETGKKYTFTVRAYKNTSNGVVLSAYDKKGISGKPELGTPVLKSAKRSASGVTFTWKKTAGATGYVVYRKANNGAWRAVKATSGTTYKDTTAKKGVKYTYTVRAYRKTSAGNVYGAYDAKGISVK